MKIFGRRIKMEFILQPEQVAFIYRQAETSYPHECCGFLLGGQSEAEFSAMKIIPAENRRTDSLHNRYNISPQDYLQTEKLADSLGQQLIGFYHSHPDHPAIPSQYDLEHAWPNLVYAIVSVQQGKAREVSAYLLAEDRSHFDTIAVVKK
jgi:proteasome lid subunit RPN8/RPN11